MLKSLKEAEGKGVRATAMLGRTRIKKQCGLWPAAWFDQSETSRWQQRAILREKPPRTKEAAKQSLTREGCVQKLPFKRKGGEHHI